jgi:hypothetical protein
LRRTSPVGYGLHMTNDANNDRGMTDMTNDNFYADDAIWDHEFCDPNECTNDDNCFGGSDDNNED